MKQHALQEGFPYVCLFDQCIDHGLQEAASSAVDLINEAMKKSVCATARCR